MTFLIFQMLVYSNYPTLISNEIIGGQMRDIYILESGDGDQRYIGQRHELFPAQESWFDGLARGQPANLFKMKLTDETFVYVAIGSKSTDSLDNQMQDSGFAMVVVNLVLKPNILYDGNDLNSTDAVGMSVLRLPEDPRFSH